MKVEKLAKIGEMGQNSQPLSPYVRRDFVAKEKCQSRIGKQCWDLGKVEYVPARKTKSPWQARALWGRFPRSLVSSSNALCKSATTNVSRSARNEIPSATAFQRGADSVRRERAQTPWRLKMMLMKTSHRGKRLTGKRVAAVRIWLIHRLCV